jgi:integrase
MHKARHTAGQRVLDQTRGSLKAVQTLLGHASISTTGDIYTTGTSRSGRGMLGEDDL